MKYVLGVGKKTELQILETGERSLLLAASRLKPREVCSIFLDQTTLGLPRWSQRNTPLVRLKRLAS